MRAVEDFPVTPNQDRPVRLKPVNLHRCEQRFGGRDIDGIGHLVTIHANIDAGVSLATFADMPAVNPLGVRIIPTTEVREEPPLDRYVPTPGR